MNAAQELEALRALVRRHAEAIMDQDLMAVAETDIELARAVGIDPDAPENVARMQRALMKVLR